MPETEKHNVLLIAWTSSILIVSSLSLQSHYRIRNNVIWPQIFFHMVFQIDAYYTKNVKSKYPMHISALLRYTHTINKVGHPTVKDIFTKLEKKNIVSCG